DKCSIAFGDEGAVLDARAIVVRIFLRSLRELDFLSMETFVRERFEKMRDHVQAHALLVVRMDEIPRCFVRIGRSEHLVARFGERVPASIRFDIHRTELPLAQWIFDPRAEAALLFRLTDLEPEFHERDSGVNDVALERGAIDEKLVGLFWRAKSHHALDA